MDEPQTTTPTLTLEHLDTRIAELHRCRLEHAEKLNDLANKIHDLEERLPVTESHLNRLNERLTEILASLGHTL